MLNKTIVVCIPFQEGVVVITNMVLLITVVGRKKMKSKAAEFKSALKAL